MAIDKRTFKGGMNKDIDQRLIPEDQYRHAENVRNMQGSDGKMGVITPIPANIQRATNFSFLTGQPTNGKVEITQGEFASNVLDFSGGKTLFLTVNFAISGPNGDAFSLSMNITESDYGEQYGNYTQLPISQANPIVLANIYANKIQGLINDTTGLADLISVSCINNVVTVSLLNPEHTLGTPILFAADTSIPSALSVPFGNARFPVTQVFTAGSTWNGITVGSVADELKRKIYYLVHQTSGAVADKKDYILEYDDITNSIDIVYAEFQNSSAILNFDRNRQIYNINIIDSKFLYFTDNFTPPKKINISKSKSGYSFYTNRGKLFEDVYHASTYNAAWSGTYSSKALLKFDTDPGFELSDVIYIEQDVSYVHEEYNGYFQVIGVNEDGTQVLLNRNFVKSSPTIPGRAWRIVDGTNNFISECDPRTTFLPEAFNAIHQHIKGQYFNAVRQGPRKKITYTYNTNDNRSKNNVFGKVWQFAYRFIYDDNEVSALSLISDIVVPAEMANNSSLGNNYNQAKNNEIIITVPPPNDGMDALVPVTQTPDNVSGVSADFPVRLYNGNKSIAKRLFSFPSNVAAIEVYARERNDAPFLLINKEVRYDHNKTYKYQNDLNTAYLNNGTIGDWQPQSRFFYWTGFQFTFLNDGIYPALDSRNADKLYDYIPHKAKTQEVIDSSAIIYGNVVDGFDPVQLDGESGATNIKLDTKYLSSDDANNSTASQYISVGFTNAFNVYINDADNSIGSAFFGNPNAFSTNDSNQGGNANPIASNSGAALVHFGGTAAANHPRNRVIIEFYLGNMPVDNNGNAKKGTTFNSAGSFAFKYKWNRLFSAEDKYGIKYTWEGITATVTDESTTVTAFAEAIRDKFRALLTQDNPDSGNTNWRNTEVYDAGTVYNATAKTLRVHFQATSNNGHSGLSDAVTNAKLQTFVVSNNSSFTTLPSSIGSFKTGAYHDFGLIYGNDKNQVSFVNKSEATKTYVKFLTEREGGQFAYGSGQTDNLGTPVISWQIHHRPPDWAHWYQWVYAGNSSVDGFIQFTCQDAAVNLTDASDQNIYLNFSNFKGKPYSYKNQDAPLIDYVFSKNDRIRFIKNEDGVIPEYIDLPLQDAVVFNYQDDESINHVKKFFQERYNTDSAGSAFDKAASGYFLVFKGPDLAGFNKSDVLPNSIENGYKGLLFEIYTPKKNFEEGPTFYYGLTDRIAIEDAETKNGIATRIHSTNAYYDALGSGFPDGFNKQDPDYDFPARGFFTQGDVFLKGRRTINYRTGGTYNANYDVNFVEGYYVNDYIDSKSYNKGRKHVYNAFAKEEHRATTVYYSGPYLPSSNINGLSEFNIIDLPFKEFSISYGEIEKLVSKDSDLIILQANKVSKALVQKQILLGATGASNVALSDQILSEAAPFQGDFGPLEAGASVSTYANKIYFVDPARGVMCRLAGDGLTVISNYGMKSYFTKYFRDRISGIGNDNRAYLHVAGFDPENSEYLYLGFLYERKGTDGELLSDTNKLVGFYESLNKYVSFYSYKPEAIQKLGSELFTFKNGYIYKHNQSTVKNDFNKFYNAAESANSELSVVFNGQPSMVKIFNNIGLEASKPWTPVHLKTDNFTGNFHTAAGEINSPTGANYWVRKEGIYYMPTPLGAREEFDYYEDKLNGQYNGVAHFEYTNDTTLTATVDVSDFVAAGMIGVLFADINTLVPVTVTAIDTTGKILTVNSLSAFTSIVVGSTYYFATNDDPNAKGIAGEKPRGVFAEFNFTLKPSELTFTNSDQDNMELHAANIDVSYSPLSYK